MRPRRTFRKQLGKELSSILFLSATLCVEKVLRRRQQYMHRRRRRRPHTLSLTPPLLPPPPLGIHAREGGRRRKTTGSSILLLTDFPSFRQGSLSSTNVSSSSSGGRGAGGRRYVHILFSFSLPPPSLFLLIPLSLSPLPANTTNGRGRRGVRRSREGMERGGGIRLPSVPPPHPAGFLFARWEGANKAKARAFIHVRYSIKRGSTKCGEVPLKGNYCINANAFD